jgi:glycine/D-amino acid oxidase-like deaminating enzyme
VLAQGVIPFRSAVIVTAPLGHNVAASILPGGQMLVDTRRLLRWYRKIDGRLFIGGRGAGAPSGDSIAYERLRGCMLELYPHLKDTPIEYRWSGLIGVTLDELPHVGRVHERIIVSGGCNGNGIAVSSLFGRYAAQYAMGLTPDIGILDAGYMVRLPLHRFSGPAVRMGTRWYEFLDRMGV